MPVHSVAQEPTGQAEPEYATPSEEERRLNDEAARAIGEGDYTKAVSYLQEALYLGELNVTYLNLGRAYQYMGRCEKARAALEKVSEAPAVRRPAAKFVDQKAAEFLAELDEDCQPQPQAPEDGGTQLPAQEPDNVEAPVAEKPTNESTEQPVDESADQPVEQPNDQPNEQMTDQASARDVLGWSSLGGGALLVGSGIGLQFWAESLRSEVSEPTDTDDQGRVLRPTQATVQQNHDTADTLDTVGLSLGIIGGAAAITGAYFLLSDDDPEQASFSVGPSVDARGVVISGNF